MPIKSKAQRRKFAQLLVEGKITDEVYERWNREAGYKELPEHVKPKPKRKAAAKRRPKRKPARAKTRPKAKGARGKSRRPVKAK